MHLTCLLNRKDVHNEVRCVMVCKQSYLFPPPLISVTIESYFELFAEFKQSQMTFHALV